MVGGSDGSGVRTETMWAVPDADGVIPQWNHLPQMDLGEGIQGSAGVTTGAYAFIIAGQTSHGVTRRHRPDVPRARSCRSSSSACWARRSRRSSSTARSASSSATWQAASVGAANFVILLLVGWGFAHKEKVRGLLARRRHR